MRNTSKTTTDNSIDKEKRCATISNDMHNTVAPPGSAAQISEITIVTKKFLRECI